jgi:hypothetical protein
MKINYIACLLLFLLLPFMSVSQEFANPVDYMDHISQQSSRIKNDMWEYSKTLAHKNNDRKIDQRRKEIISTVTEAIKIIGKMPAYEGDVTYRDSTLSYLKLTKKILNQDYAEIVNMEAIAEESFDNMEAYLTAQTRASNKLKNAASRLQVGQQSFASRHEVNLIEGEDKVADKLEIAGKVFDYQNEVYLIFFKSFKQETYLIQAMNRGDISAMEQNNRNLESFASEGLKTLERLKPYQKDKSQDKAPVLIDFFLQKERLESVKKAFEEKEDKTQEDYDAYNNMVDSYNNAREKFNSTNNELNVKRSALVDSWNETQNKFTAAHVPRK